MQHTVSVTDIAHDHGYVTIFWEGAACAVEEGKLRRKPLIGERLFLHTREDGKSVTAITSADGNQLFPV